MKTIRGCGKLKITDNIPPDNGSRVFRKFTGKLIEAFIKAASKYIELTHETPFAYRERQLNSIFAPALSKVTSTFFAEVPTRRVNKKEKIDSHGWIDFWALYRNLDFFIELKHSFISYNGGTVNQETKYRWDRALEQTQDCLSELECSYGARGFLTVPFQIIPIYEVRKPDADSKALANPNAILDIYDNFSREIHKTSNYSALWTLRENLVNNAYHESENSIEYYPAVIFLTNFSKLNC